MKSVDQFETIVHEHYVPLFRFAMSLTRMESDAKDLTQQTFYIWATKGHQLRDNSKIKTWLFTTLHRAFLKARQRQTRFFHHDLEEVLDQLPALSTEFANHADASQVLPALARVDGVYQAAVALFYLDDCSHKDIATILDVPIGTVKSRLSRGIAQLREILLSDASPRSSIDRDETFFIASPGEPAASPENTRPRAGHHIQLAARNAECGHEEWDLSPIRLREPMSVPGFIQGAWPRLTKPMTQWKTKLTLKNVQQRKSSQVEENGQPRAASDESLLGV